MKPLDSFNFALDFEAKFFAVDVDVKGENKQRYTELAHGWEGMLHMVSSAMHRYRFDGNGPFGLVENEILGHLSDVRSWTWSTTTDASPTKAVIESGLVTITVMRLFANDLERILFREMYPYGIRPGEAEVFDEMSSPSRRDITVPRLDQVGASPGMIERAGPSPLLIEFARQHFENTIEMVLAAILGNNSHLKVLCVGKDTRSAIGDLRKVATELGLDFDKLVANAGTPAEIAQLRHYEENPVILPIADIDDEEEAEQNRL